MLDRLKIVKTVLWALVGVLAVVTVVRFARGLGSTTNLSNGAPWGLWVAFDVMAGVALAAGGFVIAATVYIFGREKYRPVLRSAILTAFLGYVAVAVGLLYDLGLPWHIWHPMIYWQHHSVLFEVAMCVMFYLTVLALEFVPVVLEHSWLKHPLFHAALKILKKATIPLVITGIVLSTLHQSSLGSLFLITPGRLHPLWYSPIIYLLFFVSAVGLGLMTVAMESLFSAWLLRHKPHTELFPGLGIAASIVLSLYATLRIGDLAARGILPSALDGSPMSWLFVFELAVSALIPSALLTVRSVRGGATGIGICSAMTIIGMVLYRLDVCIVAFARPAGVSYFPSWMEFAVSLGIVAAGMLVFVFFVENFKVSEGHAPEQSSSSLLKKAVAQVPSPADGGVAAALFQRAARPSYDPATLYCLLPDRLAGPRRYSLAALIAASFTIALLPEHAVIGVPPGRTPVQAARNVDGMVQKVDKAPSHLFLAGSSSVKPLKLLLIDGNRDGNAVLFDHEQHVERLGKEASCGTCHHLDLPLDRSTDCSACHRDMYEATPMFHHSAHVSKLNGNSGCADCHSDDTLAKTFETSAACTDCHSGMVAQDAFVPVKGSRWVSAPGYKAAMHGLCIACHQQQAQKEPARFSASFTRCDCCHDSDRAEQLRRLSPGRRVQVSQQRQGD